MEQKYYNDAIVGNKNIRATLSKRGELLRLYYPNVDFKQFIDFYRVGVKINDSSIIYLHEDINNKYSQEYVENTNILKTEIENTYFNLKISQTDYGMMKENVLIRKYILKNNNKVDLKINFLINSKLLSNDNNMISAKVIPNGLIQYGHDYSFVTFSKNEINGHRINDTRNYISSGVLEDKDYIGMSNDSAISYEIGTLKPGEEKEINIYILVEANQDLKSNEDLEEKIEGLKKIDENKQYGIAKKYWLKYLESHKQIEFSGFSESTIERMKKIYNRTILLFPLLQNEETGGIAATIEIDERLSRCGRYSYCWPRDAVFITKAFDELGMKKETEKFYKVFCKNTQSKNGMWEQRFYTDGKLAPCWGYQIDETSSVIYGINEHYKITKDEKFVLDNLKMCENAMHFLFKYLSVVFDEKEEIDVVKKEIEEKAREDGKQKDEIYKHLSYDLWEMNEGVHLYSLASIYAAFNSMINMYEIAKTKYQENRLKVEQIIKNTKKMKEEMEKIKKYIASNLYDENTKVLHRNSKDGKMDVSMIGAVTPFELFGAKEKKILNTVEKMNMRLRTYTGGYIRFEEDSYMQGANPWPIATLWMALYYMKAGERKKAKECINFVTNSATDLGFLAEQVDNNTMKSNWVIGLRLVSCNVHNSNN